MPVNLHDLVDENSSHEDIDDWEYERRKWEAERAFNHFSDEQFEHYWRNVVEASEAYGDMTVPYASAIDAMIEAHDQAREAHGMQE
jgi:hypothetical protein